MLIQCLFDFDSTTNLDRIMVFFVCVCGGGEEVLYVFSKYNLNIITENQEKKKILHTRKSSHVLLLQSVPKTF